MSMNCEYCKANPAVADLQVDKWSGMGRDVSFSYCSEECRDGIMDAAARVRRGAPWFLAGLGALGAFSLAFTISSIVSHNLAVIRLIPPLLLMVGGGLLALFPLVASRAVRMLGIRSAQRYARRTGAVMMMAGLVFYLFLALIFGS